MDHDLHHHHSDNQQKSYDSSNYNAGNKLQDYSPNYQKPADTYSPLKYSDHFNSTDQFRNTEVPKTNISNTYRDPYESSQ